MLDKNTNSGDYIFSTTDPFGKKVRLKSTTWQYHITGGDHTGKEFINQEDVIRDVISDPGIILPNNPDDENDTRQKYIDIVQLPEFKSLKALVVVVDHENDTYGDVVTVMAKARLNQETGGAIYVRPKLSRQE